MFDYSIDESFNTDYDKAPYAKKIQLNLLKDGQIKLSALSSLTERLKFKKKNKGLEGQSEKILDALKSANELMADNGEKIKTLTPRIVIELNRL
jgi:carboxyl-terminal processing protease